MGEGYYGPKLRAAGVEVVCLNMPRGSIIRRAHVEHTKLIDELSSDEVQTWMYHAALNGGVYARLARVRSVFWGIRNSGFSKDGNKMTLLLAYVSEVASRFIPDII